MNSPVRIQHLLRDGRFDAAERLCQQAISQNPTDGEAWLKLAAVHQRRGAKAQAIEDLEVAATCGAGTTTGLRVAQALIQLSAYDRAQKVLATLDPAQPEVVLQMARAAWGGGDYRRAVVQLSALWEARPEWLALAVTYARSLVNLDQMAKAGEVLETALAHHTGQWLVQQQYVSWLISNRSPAAAAEWLAGQSVVEPNPGLGTETMALYRWALGELTAGEAPLPAAGRQNGDGRYDARREGFVCLRNCPGPVVWYGDNVTLLKKALAAAPAGGAIVECGVLHGRTLNLLAAWSGREVHGFDSFQGLPEDWSEREGAGSYSTGGRVPAVAPNATLHPGWFAETLPPFAATLSQPIAVLHVDCDLYSSTRTVLAHLGPHLAPGAVVVFDEYTGYPGWREHEDRAFREWCAESGAGCELIGAVVLGQTAAFRIVGGQWNSESGCADAN